MDSNLPRLQLELYKEIKKVRKASHLEKKCCILSVVIKLMCWFEERCLSESEGSPVEIC